MFTTVSTGVRAYSGDMGGSNRTLVTLVFCVRKSKVAALLVIAVSAVSGDVTRKPQ